MRFCFLILLLFNIAGVNGQDRRCGTGLLHDIESSGSFSETNISALRSSENPVDGLITIPVVVHVIHNNSNGEIGGSNISKEQIESQIQVLNEDFGRMQGTRGYNTDPIGADMEIRFCLAQRDTNGFPTDGIVRKYYPKKYWAQRDNKTIKKLSYWHSDKYLNIWVVNISDQGIIGWAQFPEGTPGVTDSYDKETDGVVIHYKAMGRIGDLKPDYDLGRTATHEIGHWLGLRHLWGDSDCGDDYVDDTPWDFKSAKTCADSSDCDGDGVFTRDMTNNYLDFSYDACMNLFTEGQKERVRNTFLINARRNALISSMGCQPPTGIKEANLQNISLYPNPVSDNLFIDFKNTCSGTAYLYSSINELVAEEHFSSATKIDLDLFHLNSGFYFLILDTDKGKIVKKVIRK